VQRYRAVYRGGKLLAEYENGVCIYQAPEAVSENRSDLPSPMYVRDIGEYKSPIDGTMITSRSAHRDHLKAHDVIEVGNERVGSGPAEAPKTRDIGEAIKRRIEEVKALPQATYDEQVKVQAAVHAEVASTIKAD
jgi:hypothetical protein